MLFFSLLLFVDGVQLGLASYLFSIMALRGTSTSSPPRTRTPGSPICRPVEPT